MLTTDNTVDAKSQNHGETASVQVMQLSIDPQLLRFVEQGGAIAFILALSFFVGMLTRFVEKVKK